MLVSVANIFSDIPCKYLTIHILFFKLFTKRNVLTGAYVVAGDAPLIHARKNETELRLFSQIHYQSLFLIFLSLFLRFELNNPYFLHPFFQMEA